MRALVQDRFGEPGEVLSVREVPKPTPKSGEVLVRMLASPINPSDLIWLAVFTASRRRCRRRRVLKASGSSRNRAADSLAGIKRASESPSRARMPAVRAEYVVIPAKQAVPIPASLSIEQAASAFVNPTTAYAMTRRVLNVPKDAWLLQTAAASVVGRMVISLGKHFAFRTINVVRRREQAKELQNLAATSSSPRMKKTSSRR